MGAGITSTAALFIGGRLDPPPSHLDNVESYNGSAWSEVAETNTARRDGAGFGSSTSAVAASGAVAPAAYGTVNAETWDGTAWTEVGNVNGARIEFSGSGSSSSAGMIFGGFSHPPDKFHDETETWNGTSWTEVADLATGRQSTGAGSSISGSVSALLAGGHAPGYTAATEEWNVPGVTKTLTVS